MLAKNALCGTLTTIMCFIAVGEAASQNSVSDDANIEIGQSAPPTPRQPKDGSPVPQQEFELLEDKELRCTAAGCERELRIRECLIVNDEPPKCREFWMDVIPPHLNVNEYIKQLNER